jgi:subtilase family serine protease
VNGSFKLVAPLVAAVAIAACNAGGTSNMPAGTGASQGTPLSVRTMPQWMVKHEATPACPQVAHTPTCLALQVTKNGISPACSPSGGCGFTATELEAAYGISGDLGKGSGTKVAVIEVGDYADATSDLAAYRTEYGLGTGNLTRYNAGGQTGDYPSTCQDYGWCLETALDIDMVSASCPKCDILLMEATDAISSLEEAETSAVKLGATVVSNSWICYGDWDCGDPSFGSYFDTKGVAYLASSGDEGYNEIGGPSVLDSVVAIGGTQLAGSGTKYTSTIWSDAGAGCASSSIVGSPGVPKPSWQKDPDCTSRTDADVSLEAGCAPGVAEYSTFYGGWTGVCGTSVASPFSAGIIALKGNAKSWKGNGGERFWTLSSKKLAYLYDITSGSDGSCGGEYLCTAGTKQFGQYSGPGGWGSALKDTDY